MDEEKVVKAFERGRASILVRPNAKKDELLCWDEEKNAFRVAIAARAENNEANLAVIKFFSKLAGKRVHIIKGLKSKSKILSITP